MKGRVCVFPWLDEYAEMVEMVALNGQIHL